MRDAGRWSKEVMMQKEEEEFNTEVTEEEHRGHREERAQTFWR
jgi:hypothetical protein